MRRKFKSKKRRLKRSILIGLFIFIVIICTYQMIIGILMNIKLKSSNEEFLKSLLNDSNHYLAYSKSPKNYFNYFIKLISNIDLKKPTTILENNIKVDNKNMKLMYTASDDEYSLNSSYIEDTKEEVIEDPSVYIYNTHQLEEYNSTNLEEYNIRPNVLMASYILREYLNKNNIKTIVETADITDFLNVNGWSYSNSYKASRYYLDEAIKKHNNLKLIIDLHRDSITYNLSTTTIENKKYAKVLFVVGLDHENYEANLALASKLNSLINSKYPTLSRGILKKSGKGVNGIYNQDASKNVVLIECGGYQNSIDEVMNTMIALSDVIKEYLGGV